jgi:hypothetical protein
MDEFPETRPDKEETFLDTVVETVIQVMKDYWPLVLFIVALLVFAGWMILSPSVVDSQPARVVTWETPGKITATLTDEFHSTDCGSPFRPRDSFNYFCITVTYEGDKTLSFAVTRNTHENYKVGDSIPIILQ